ncbi:hypothetical protein [Chamaesiphon sp. VAR_48_metabat_135_sub]|uniref:hypothetical protein n=1 Tax=Chamaesiphon sp. VAR_48_metabat_135_sub TaxID=2964699 RepID=UPI00286BB4E6|nr:hypothetical protein [Chamaesiphon sp. VAR_48_metabat_135_sub]
MKLATATAFSIPLILLNSLSTFAQFKPGQYNQNPVIENPNIQRINPGLLCKVCVQWEKGAPGTFVGPCIRYEYRPCGTSPVIN